MLVHRRFRLIQKRIKPRVKRRSMVVQRRFRHSVALKIRLEMLLQLLEVLNLHKTGR